MSNTTGDQRRSCRQYSGDLSPAQLARYFHLDTLAASGTTRAVGVG